MVTITKANQIRQKAQAAVAAARVKGYKLSAMAQTAKVKALAKN